jgi:hypothetical protein
MVFLFTHLSFEVKDTSGDAFSSGITWTEQNIQTTDAAVRTLLTEAGVRKINNRCRNKGAVSCC